MNKIKNFLFSISVALVLMGCSTGLNYRALEKHMAVHDCAAANAFIESSSKDYGSNGELLFLLDSAMIHMLCGNHEKSNEYFHRAEALTEELLTKSITRESSAFLLNDYTVPYSGEDFEKALINLFSAINYMKLGQFDDSLVEIRRLDSLLTMINDQYSKKNVYKEDAFARYVSGILYEADKNLNDAYIDYYKALAAFKDYQNNYGTPVPSSFIQDLIRVAKAAGRADEVQKVIDDYGDGGWTEYDKIGSSGRIILIHLNGLAPVKRSTEIFIPTRDGPVALAFPRYEIKQPYCRGSQFIAVSDTGRITSQTELVEDINQIAVKNLDDRRARITLKMAARVAVKQVAIHKVENKTARELLNIANLFVERADTRAWRTLPGEIYLGSLFVPPAEYDIRVSQCGEKERYVETVSVSSGKTTFVLYETMY